jgi:flagellar hook-associated protein 1 FlgK
MPLTESMGIARSSLSTLQERTSVVSRNVANAGNDLASRKLASPVTAPGGGVRLGPITRATDTALFAKVLGANAAVGGESEISKALDQLNQTIGDPEQDISPAAMVGKLNTALQQYSAGPQDPVRAQAALGAAKDLAKSLNDATQTVADVRQQADADIKLGVQHVNELLAEVEQLNTEIVKGTQLGDDVTDQLDSRDQALAQISTELGIRVVARPNNDIAVYTDSGITLFDHTARQLSFAPSPVYSSTTTGNPLVVDGVPVTGTSASMPIGTGRLKGLTDIRDSIAVTYQNQLDEIARGIVETFAEQDQSGSGLPDATGMFSYGGSPAVPPSGTLVPGLAGQISVNAAVDPERGGDLNRIRDGGINGAAYNYNPSGAAGYSGRISALSSGLTTNRPFDPAAQAGATDSVQDFASTSVGWLSQERQASAAALEFNQTVQVRAVDAFTQVNGVNLDLEMTLLLEIERSYQATSRLISTIDSMYQSIIGVV